jgi:hypothetical protein
MSRRPGTAGGVAGSLLLLGQRRDLGPRVRGRSSGVANFGIMPSATLQVAAEILHHWFSAMLRTSGVSSGPQADDELLDLLRG